MGSSVLAFDFGLRRIGVAVGEPVLQTANVLTVIQNRESGPDWQHIDKLLKEWQPAQLVIGVPRKMDGSETDLTRAAKHFGRELKDRCGVAVAEVDERLSSQEAERMLADARSSGRMQRRTRHEDVDMLAAQIILERWYVQAHDERE
jgi:putative Holliday junction resolvase